MSEFILSATCHHVSQFRQYVLDHKLFLSFIFSKRFILVTVMLDPKPIPGEFTPDGMPVYHRALHTHIHTRSHTSKPKSNLQQHFFYTMEGEHRGNSCWGSSCEAAMLPTVPAYSTTSIMHINTLKLKLIFCYFIHTQLPCMQSISHAN